MKEYITAKSIARNEGSIDRGVQHKINPFIILNKNTLPSVYISASTVQVHAE